MTLLKALQHTRARRLGIVAILLGLLILVMATWRPSPDAAATVGKSSLPQPVLASLSKKAVWCYADYQNRLGRNHSLGYYPNASLSEALSAPGSQGWIAKEAVSQSVRCYTSWEAAFYHHDGPEFTRRNNTMEQVRSWLPGDANEADYEVAVLFSVFKGHWQKIRNPAFSPSIQPHRWALTEGLGNTTE